MNETKSTITTDQSDEAKLYDILPITMALLITSHHHPNRQDHPHVDHPQPVGLFPGKYSVAMVKGDCSLTISNVDLKIDDGEWECQVSILSEIFLQEKN